MMFIKRFPSFLTSLISLLGAILFLGAAACQPSKQSERITEQKSEQLGTQGLAKTSKPVEVAVAKTDEIRSELNLSGTIMPNAKVSIFSKMAGQIVKMPVEVGQQVNKGDLLAVIEHEELLLNKRQAQAAYRSAEAAYNQVQKLARIQIEGQVAQAQASVSAAETSLQQVKDLSETRAKSQIQQAESGLASLQANLEKIKRGARAEDRQQAQAAVDQAKASLSNAKSNFERLQQLFEDGAISLQSFESSQTQLDISKAQYQMALEQQKLIEKGAQVEDIQSMEAQVEQAKAALSLAQVSSQTKSWEKDIALSKSQVEAAKAGLRTAQSSLEAKSWEVEIIAAETQMIRAQTTLNLVNKQLSDSSIEATITGVISARNFDLGSMAVPNVALFEIVQMEQLKVIINVIESDLAKISLGREVTINVDVSNTDIFGEIIRISPTLDLVSRSARVEIKVDNTIGQLKPGMFAKVNIPVEVRENVVLIPRSALIGSQKEQSSVFVVDENNTGQRRQVKLGLSQGDIVEVDGIDDGDRVIVAGQFSLKSGDLVRVVD
ncbi:MAG: efflux RND transporter periplasmic adaptor subunit [Candidatus Poribacteria bacterium]|nr:efflux RND transporter periplasmic adaptor subunit [Candidatus Poribacteria bacterium]